MLVHICCSVDSHYFLEELKKEYPDENLVGFFYNPNIHPKSEHDLRLSDVARTCKMLGIELIVGEYSIASWLSDTKGYEEEPEKGARCNICFDNRLLESAKVAKQRGISTFTTTLLSSPMKEQLKLYAQGDEIAKNHDLEFIKINVRKNGGVDKQNAIAKENNLYRQNYCGCKFALDKQREKQGKLSLEMMSNITGQIMPGSIESRLDEFAKRDMIERDGGGYVLTQQGNLVWRLLGARIYHQKEVIKSYIIARSSAKHRAKSGLVVWTKPKLENFYHIFEGHLRGLGIINAFKFLHKKEQEYMSNPNILIGYSKRDDSIFLDIESLNFFLCRDYKNVDSMLRNPPSYQDELALRYCLSGLESLNPIVILDEKICHDMVLEIDSILQDEKIYVCKEEIPHREEMRDAL